MSQLNHGDNDIIQLGEPAVLHLLPSYATEADMYEALERSKMTQREIFDTLDRSFTEEQLDLMNEQVLASVIHDIIFSSFVEAIDSVTAHKAPLNV